MYIVWVAYDLFKCKNLTNKPKIYIFIIKYNLLIKVNGIAKMILVLKFTIFNYFYFLFNYNVFIFKFFTFKCKAKEIFSLVSTHINFSF